MKKTILFFVLICLCLTACSCDNRASQAESSNVDLSNIEEKLDAVINATKDISNIKSRLDAIEQSIPDVNLSDVESKLDTIIENDNDVDLSNVESKLDTIIQNGNDVDLSNIESKLESIIAGNQKEIVSRSLNTANPDIFFSTQYSFSNVSIVGDKLCCICYVTVVSNNPNCQYDSATATVSISYSGSWKINSDSFGGFSDTCVINLDVNGFGTGSFCFVSSGDAIHPLVDGEVTCKISRADGTAKIELDQD